MLEHKATVLTTVRVRMWYVTGCMILTLKELLKAEVRMAHAISIYGLCYGVYAKLLAREYAYITKKLLNYALATGSGRLGAITTSSSPQNVESLNTQSSSTLTTRKRVSWG